MEKDKQPQDYTPEEKVMSDELIKEPERKKATLGRSLSYGAIGFIIGVMVTALIWYLVLEGIFTSS